MSKNGFIFGASVSAFFIGVSALTAAVINHAIDTQETMKDQVTQEQSIEQKPHHHTRDDSRDHLRIKVLTPHGFFP